MNLLRASLEYYTAMFATLWNVLKQHLSVVENRKINR